MSVSVTNTPARPPQFTSKVVPKEQTHEIVKIAKNWLCKVEAMQSNNMTIDPVTQSRLRASGIIIDKIRAGLEHGTFYNGNIWDTILVSIDNAGVQTIALVEERKNKLVYLATNPENIAGKDPVRGAAKHIIVELARQSLKSRKDLRLSSTREAEEFYKKLGFIVDNESYAFKPLILTVEKIKQLVSDKVSPFDQITLEPELQGYSSFHSDSLIK